MARTKTNIITREFSGKLGDQVVFRQLDGMTVLANIPARRKTKPTGRQAETCDRFSMAINYARNIVKDPEMKAAYKARAGKRVSANNMAIRDFLSPPVVKEIDTSAYQGLSGQKIRISATDDFKVKLVTVTITDTEGKKLESGSCAVGLSGFSWYYTAQTDLAGSLPLIITAMAWDIPGNTGSMTKEVMGW
jgi:hypothetical protein